MPEKRDVQQNFGAKGRRLVSSMRERFRVVLQCVYACAMTL
jgi:hypothetical protein